MLTPDPETYNPRLTRWGHLWRAALCLSISTLVWWKVAGHQWTEDRLWFWIDLAGGVVAFALVLLRRRWPFPIALLVTLLSLVSVSSAGPGALALVSLATRRKFGEIIAVGAVSVVTGQLYSYYQPVYNNDPPWLNFTFVTVVTVALSVFGMYVGSRRELLWTLRERARQAESEQELRINQARSAERERIAREMHDVLAHRISLVAMHAGALVYRDDLTPDEVHETSVLIQQKAHEALTDLRQVLGVLRGAEAPDARPQPTLADLPALAEEATLSGMVVDLQVRVADSATGSEQIGRTVYRVVQEGLTNARKHAGGAHVRIQVSGSPETGIDVEICNGHRVGSLGIAPTPGSGLGLVGLRERAVLAGGTLHVSDSAAGFTLRCWLPWTPP